MSRYLIYENKTRIQTNDIETFDTGDGDTFNIPNQNLAQMSNYPLKYSIYVDFSTNCFDFEKKKKRFDFIYFQRQERE